MAKSVLFVKTQSCVFVLFRSKAAKLSLAFNLSQGPDHKPPGFFSGAELTLELSSFCPSVCHNVSVFHYLSSRSVSCPHPLSLTDWLSHSVSTSLSSVCLSLWHPHERLLSTHHAQTVLLLLCASLTDCFSTLSGGEAVVTPPTAFHWTPPTPLSALTAYSKRRNQPKQLIQTTFYKCL